MNLRLPAVSASQEGGRPLTGRTVLIVIVAFFAIVTLVNVVMIRAAISTFGGVDTPSSYQAGLAFKADEAAAAAQNARGWHVAAHVAAAAEGASATIEVQAADGRPVTGAVVDARFAHPIDERRDVAIAIDERGSGTYAGKAAVGSGQWNLVLEISEHGERLFRSVNRIVIP